MKIYILFFLIIFIFVILIKNNIENTKNIEKKEILFYKCNKYVLGKIIREIFGYLF